MPKKQDRSNAYYEHQLEKRFPAVHADFRGGKYPSLREALIAAGMKRPRTRLQELKNAWKAAADSERNEFVRWLRTERVGLKSTMPRSTVSRAPIATDQRLEPWSASRILAIMAKRHLKTGDVMHELAFSRLNASLGSALSRGTRLRPDILAALEKWLVINNHV